MQSKKLLENPVDSLESEVDSFDLIVIFKEWIGRSYQEIDGINQIEIALKNMKSYYIKETEFYDVVTLDVAIEDPYEIIQQLNKASTEFIKKAVPIDAIVPSDSDQIINTALEVAARKISKGKSFTVECELRSKYHESLSEVREKITDEICKRLNQEYVHQNPDWIILIEELGENTAIAIQHPDEILINL